MALRPEITDPIANGGAAAPELAYRFWHQALVLAFLTSLLVVMNVYYDEHAMDLSLIPRLRGLYAALIAAIFFLILPPVARRLDFSALRDPLVLCYGAFSVTCFVTMAFALNPSAGFTDAFKTFGAFIFLCLLCLLLPTISSWRELLLQVVVCGAALSAGWGYYEMTAILGFGLHPRMRMESVLGTMGNTNLYAGFLALVLPLCLCAAVILRSWWRVAACIATAATALMIALLQTRSAYLGFAASMFVGLPLVVVFAPKLGIGPKLRRVLAFLAVVIPLAIVSFALFAPETNPLAERLRSMGDGAQSRSLSNRLMAWQITTKMARDHFPWGVGTGNFTLHLDEYFNADQGFHGDNTNWTYPHNDFLWVLAEQGLFGIVFFLGLFILAARCCLFCLQRAHSRQNAWLAVGVMMSLSAYLMDSAFSFPLARVSHQIYLALAFALAVLIARAERGESGTVAPSQRYPRGLLAGAVPALVVLALGFSYARAAIKQEFYLSVVFALEAEKMWPAALRVLRAAASPWKTTDPFATPWPYHEARVLKSMGAPDEEILDALERAYALNPNRLHVINDLGAYYGKTGQIERAIELFAQTAQRYPYEPTSRENLAQCYIDQDDYASALKILEEIPEDRRTEDIRTKIIGCRQALEAAESAPADKSARQL